MKQLCKYFINSCIVTVLDVVIVWVLHIVFNVDVVLANTCGVVIGFLVDYVLSALFVFEHANSKNGFAIYFVTFILGLILADILIYIGEGQLFRGLERNLCFLMSKGLSIGVPFFILYFIRKKSYEWLGKEKGERI